MVIHEDCAMSSNYDQPQPINGTWYAPSYGFPLEKSSVVLFSIHGVTAMAYFLSFTETPGSSNVSEWDGRLPCYLSTKVLQTITMRRAGKSTALF